MYISDKFSVNELLKFTLTQIKILQLFGKIAKSNARGTEAILVDTKSDASKIHVF